jgi:alkylation response protein AidB-like acyl-CoA dehydrogenase
MTIKSIPDRFADVIAKLGPIFSERASSHDLEGRFVADNYALLKEHKLFSVGVPKELGGGGASHAELCGLLCELAQACGSTALALSMHQHLVAAAVWRSRRGMPGEELLRKVAAAELVLVSTGAGDWVDSTGRAERVDGGFRVNAIKRFGSGCPGADLMITSAAYDDPARGAEVLHFPLSMRAEGVSIRSDWDTLGMRGTGSHSIELKDVFVPDAAISMRRPQGQWHPSLSTVLIVAAPIFMSPYLGIATKAAALARANAAKQAKTPASLQSLGEMENDLVTARMAWSEMIALANGYDFEPTTENASAMLIRKTIATKAAIATVAKASEVVGGAAYFRRTGLELLSRDVQAAAFHPLPEKKQLDFTGRVALGLSPIG